MEIRFAVSFSEWIIISDQQISWKKAGQNRVKSSNSSKVSAMELKRHFKKTALGSKGQELWFSWTFLFYILAQTIQKRPANGCATWFSTQVKDGTNQERFEMAFVLTMAAILAATCLHTAEFPRFLDKYYIYYTYYIYIYYIILYYIILYYIILYYIILYYIILYYIILYYIILYYIILYYIILYYIILYYIILPTHQLWESQTNSKVKSAEGVSLQHARCPAQTFEAFLGCHKPLVNSPGCFHLGFWSSFFWKSENAEVSHFPIQLGHFGCCSSAPSSRRAPQGISTDFRPFLSKTSAFLPGTALPSLEAYFT